MLAPLTDSDPPQVGPYQLKSRIGAGGMGVVYLGFGPSGKPAAVKVPAPVLVADADFRARFRTEVAAARRVHGRSVAAVIDADVDSARPWMATEYVEGSSLSAAVADRERLSDRLLHGLAIGLADALVTIHEAGVVHRDLKPSNIILAWDGPKVIDFGIARASEDSTSYTRTGMLVGSPAWMSPEQLRAERVGPATDVFAWGTCVAFAATGRPPFRGDRPEVAMAQILALEPDLTGVPADLVGLVRSALEKEPANRPTATDLLETIVGQPLDAGRDADEAASSALARLWSLTPPATPSSAGSPLSGTVFGTAPPGSTPSAAGTLTPPGRPTGSPSFPAAGTPADPSDADPSADADAAAGPAASHRGARSRAGRRRRRPGRAGIALVAVLLLAAAIAIPIALHNSNLHNSNNAGAAARSDPARDDVLNPDRHAERIVYTDQNSQIEELWRPVGGAWSKVGLNARTGAPPAAGRPFIQETAVGGVATVRVVYRATNGHVVEIQRSTGEPWRYTDIGAQAGAPAAAGDPFGYVTTVDGSAPAGTTIVRVVYRGTDNTIQEISLAPGGTWHHADIGNEAGAPAAAGDPFADVSSVATDSGEAAGTPVARVFYRGADNALYDLYLTQGKPWQATNLSQLAQAPPAAGDPVATVATVDGDAANTKPIIRIHFRGTDNTIGEIRLAHGGGWVYAPVSELAQGPPAAGDPVAGITRVDGAGTARVLYRGTDNAVDELELPSGGPWLSANLSQIAHAPAAASDPVILQDGHGQPKEIRVLYADGAGELTQLTLRPGGQWLGEKIATGVGILGPGSVQD